MLEAGSKGKVTKRGWKRVDGVIECCPKIRVNWLVEKVAKFEIG